MPFPPPKTIVKKGAKLSHCFIATTWLTEIKSFISENGNFLKIKVRWLVKVGDRYMGIRSTIISTFVFENFHNINLFEDKSSISIFKYIFLNNYCKSLTKKEQTLTTDQFLIFKIYTKIYSAQPAH